MADEEMPSKDKPNEEMPVAEKKEEQKPDQQVQKDHEKKPRKFNYHYSKGHRNVIIGIAILIIVAAAAGFMLGTSGRFASQNATDSTGKSNLSAAACSSSSDCPANEICYNPPDCGLGPNGTISCPLRDDSCHVQCQSNAYCPPGQHCLIAQWSDTNAYMLCFPQNVTGVEPNIIQTNPGTLTGTTLPPPLPVTDTNQTNSTASNNSTQQAAQQNGLAANYYLSSDLAGDPAATGTVSDLDISWNDTNPPPTPVDWHRFSATFSGSVQIDQPGDYIFILTSDDGSRIYIDNLLMGDIWASSGVNSISVTRFNLTAGQHPIRVDYRNLGGGLAKVRLEYWASAIGIPRQVIPASKLSPAQA